MKTATAAATVATGATASENSIVPLDAMLEFVDGSTFQGISFGAEGKSIAGECVFQTGDALLNAHLHHHFLIFLFFQAWLDT
jgi:hypothetical protein